MARIIRDHAIVEDEWTRLPDEQPVTNGDIIVSWERWLAEHDVLENRSGRLGVCIEGTMDPAEVGAEAHRFDLIAIEFPAFKDGRGYSHARLLRERFGFSGELRATGDVLRDQLFYLARVGFNAFETRADRCIRSALEGLRDFSVSCQKAVDDTPVLPRWQRVDATALTDYPRAVGAGGR